MPPTTLNSEEPVILIKLRLLGETVEFSLG